MNLLITTLVAWINLGPCSMLPPHFHPRAVNWVTALSGNTTTYMYEENGAHTIKTQLDFGKATLFPRGSIHCMVNQGMSCLTRFMPLLLRSEMAAFIALTSLLSFRATAIRPV